MIQVNMFPQLKTVLNGHYEMLKGRTFDEIYEAAKIQNTRGNEAARKYLEAFHKAKAA